MNFDMPKSLGRSSREEIGYPCIFMGDLIWTSLHSFSGRSPFLLICGRDLLLSRRGFLQPSSGPLPCYLPSLWERVSTVPGQVCFLASSLPQALGSPVFRHRPILISPSLSLQQPPFSASCNGIIELKKDQRGGRAWKGYSYLGSM